jgi:GNAT superfamily N-acetyltransferase
MNESISIRPMSPAEVDLALEWAACEGWNPGVADAGCLRSADPDGFLMAFVEGEPAASLSAVRYGDSFGFIGLYIAAPPYRGRGIARRLWQAGMAHLGDRLIGLDGVPERQQDYRRSGFELAWRNVRYSGSVAVPAPDDVRLVPIEPALMPPVRNYDRPFFPVARTQFLDCWLEPSEVRRSWAFIDPGAGGASGRVRGYGTIRQCRAGWKIGPLFADDAVCADLLFRRLAASADTGPVILDLPEPNSMALDLAKGYGLAPVFETARMYRGQAPSLPLDRIYGITTFELG